MAWSISYAKHARKSSSKGYFGSSTGILSLAWYASGQGCSRNSSDSSCLLSCFSPPHQLPKGRGFQILTTDTDRRRVFFYQAICLVSDPNSTNSKAKLHPHETPHAEGRGRWLAPLSASFHVDPPQLHVITSANQNEPQSTAMNHVLKGSGCGSSSLPVPRMLRLKLPNNLDFVWTLVNNQGQAGQRND